MLMIDTITRLTTLTKTIMAKVIRTYGDPRIERYSDEKERNPYRDEHGRYTIAPPSLYDRITLAFAHITSEIAFFALIGITLYSFIATIAQRLA